MGLPSGRVALAGRGSRQPHSQGGGCSASPLLSEGRQPLVSCGQSALPHAKPRCRQTAPPRSRQRRLISASAKDGTSPPFPGGAELALSPPFRVGLNWHFPPLSGWGKPPAAASEARTRAASRPPQPRRRCRRRSPGPRLAQTRRQRVRSGRESGRNSPEDPHSLSKSEDSDPIQPLEEDWHFPPSFPLFSSGEAVLGPYMGLAVPRATQAAISTLRFQRS